MSLGFLTRSDTNQAVQPQKMPRGLKLRIKEVEGLFFPCSENKSSDQLRDADLVSVFAYAKSPFSHDAAQMSLCMYWAFRRARTKSSLYLLDLSVM